MPNTFTMAPKKAMTAMNLTKAMKKAAKTTKNNNDAAAAPKVNKVKNAKKSTQADAGMGFEVLLTICRQCKDAVEIVRCLDELQVMTLTEYYCRQGCTTPLELHAVLIK